MSNDVVVQPAHDATAPKLKDALAADRDKYDCTSCRLIGAGTFVGLGGFTFFSGHHQLRQQQQTILKSGSRIGMAPRRAGITLMSLSMVGIGLYRLVN